MKKIEILVNNLKKVFNERLISVILYGKYVQEDILNVKKHEKINLMVVVDKLKASDLKVASSSVKKWTDAKHALPVFMDINTWNGSMDTYPMEYLDILTRNKTVYGQNLISSINIEKKSVRLQCEYELKSFLFQIRGIYLDKINPKYTEEAIIRNYPRIVRISKAMLYFLDEEISENEEEIMIKIAEKSGISKELLLLPVRISQKKYKINKNMHEEFVQNLLDCFSSLLSYINSLEIAK